MSVGTSIEWTHIPGTVPATMNALVGCQKVSAGCKHCYAIGVAHVRAGNPLPVMQEKFGGTTERTGAGLNWTGKVTLSEKALLEPLTKRKPHTYFVNSMSDLFYDGVPDEWIDRHYAVFALCPQHTFIVLTKRPERMQRYLGARARNAEPLISRMEKLLQVDRICNKRLLNGDYSAALPLPNVWHLVSVEDQKSADERIPLLLQTPSAVRGVSCEPMCGPVNVTPWTRIAWQCSGCRSYFSGGYKKVCPKCQKENYWSGSHAFNPPGRQIGSGLDWVICGGESGASARPMHPDWARGLRDQCQAAGVPFFFKQWGEWAEDRAQVRENGGNYRHTWMTPDGKLWNGHVHGAMRFFAMGKKAAGHLLDGREWHQFPEVKR